MGTRHEAAPNSRTAAKALEALFPGPRRQLLSALFGEPERWWTLPELAGRVGLQPASLRPHLGPLRESGVLREKRADGRSLWQPDPASPIFAELQAIVAKLTAKTQETILIVEDQPATAQITRILLESWGYHVIEARNGAEAIQLFEDHGDSIRLLLSDVIMPEMTGPQLADELMRRNPDMRVIFMSGYPREELTHRNCAFLPKPFNPAGLSRIVRKELDREAGTGSRMNAALD